MNIRPENNFIKKRKYEVKKRFFPYRNFKNSCDRRFFLFAGLMLLTLFYDAKCYTFKCNLAIEPRAESDIKKSHDQIACIAKIESYDGDHLKMASFDLAAMDKFDANGDASGLMKFSGKKPISEMTEVVKITGHRFETHPRGIGSQFPSITNFTLSNGKLWRLIKEDLKYFPNILYMDYRSNEIQYLETDLFIFNSKVESINLHSNHITQISRLVGFVTIAGLRIVELGGNKCTQVYYSCSCSPCGTCESKISNLTEQLMGECPELETQLITDVKTEIVKVDADLKATKSLLGKNLTDVQSFIYAEAEKTARIEAQIIKINQNIENHNDIIDRVYNILMMAQEEPERILRSKALKNKGHEKT